MSFVEFINQNEFIRMFFVTFVLFAILGFSIGEIKEFPSLSTIFRSAVLIGLGIFIIWIIGKI